MSLSPGTRLGAYTVVAPLGAGGMGEVYRAADTTLGREVALKLLPEAFASDPERIARFEREARLLASVNHPAIAHLYGFEKATLDGGGVVHFIAMELVEGEDLAERLKRGPIPVDESLAIAKQVAEALEEAHEKGIIHRDLKPGNVKVTPDGKVKVLDFGLAKAWSGESGGVASSADLSQSPTLAHTGTAAGLILGTAAYMSPEQARGRVVDKRADVWAFGALLYEMLAGRRLFEGETVSDTLAAVLKTDPEWAALPTGTPETVRKLLRRCLERDPKQRLRDIGEARIALGDAGGLSATSDTPAGSRAAASWRSPLAWAALALVAVASAGVGAWSWARLRPPAPGTVTRFTIPLPPGQVLAGNSGPAITRDGRRIAYVAGDASGVSRLHVRALDRFESSVIPDSEGAQQPFFSPDGEKLGFFARGKLLTAAVSGGAPTPIADGSYQTFGGTWGEDDTIVFVPNLMTGLLRVPSSGGKPRALTTPDGASKGYGHVFPQFLPGGRSVLFTVWGGPNQELAGAALLPLESAEWTSVLSTASSASATPGHLLLSGPRGVTAVPFDPDHPRPAGARTLVLDDVFSTPNIARSWFGASATGTLVYVPGDPALGTLAWVDRDGTISPIEDQPSRLKDPSLSPDGTRVVLVEDFTLWMMELRRGTRTRLTLDDEGTNRFTAWSRDGTRVLFASNRSGDFEIYSVPAGGGKATLRLARPGIQFPLSEAPDGSLLFAERARGSATNLLVLSPDGAVTPFVVSPFSNVGGQFSPDGRTVAYVSDETGRDEVYVRSLARPGDVVGVSTDGGGAPRWSPDGKQLFYRRGDAFLVASVTSAGPLSVSDSRKLFEIRAAPGSSTQIPSYGVSPDGRRFLVRILDPRAIPTQINVVQNWFEELKAKVPVR